MNLVFYAGKHSGFSTTLKYQLFKKLNTFVRGDYFEVLTFREEVTRRFIGGLMYDVNDFVRVLFRYMQEDIAIDYQEYSRKMYYTLSLAIKL
jgi:hypothetical protein